MADIANSSNNTLHTVVTTPAIRDRVAIIMSLPFRASYQIAMDVFAPVNLFLVPFGIAANILNTFVFLKTGARDNVTVSFVALSVSDLLYLVLMSPHIIVSSLNHLIQFRLGIPINWVVDPSIMLYLFYWYALVFYETSVLITVYISVVRWACVAIPFKVKTAFTARRAIIAFAVFFVSVLLIRLPTLMKRRIGYRFNPALNRTQAVYVELDDGGLADKLNDIINRNILTWTSFVTVITCMVVMVTKLQASARFRLKTSGTSLTREIPFTDKKDLDFMKPKTRSSEISQPRLTDDRELGDITSGKETTQEMPNNQGEGHTTSQGRIAGTQNPVTTEKPNVQVLSNKEAQIIRSVVLVAIVFVTCQLPFMTYSLIRRFDSRFDDTTSGNISVYLFFFALCANLSNVFSLINASVNIFIYYNFNSRYRECMKKTVEM